MPKPINKIEVNHVYEGLQINNHINIQDGKLINNDELTKIMVKEDIKNNNTEIKKDNEDVKVSIDDNGNVTETIRD